MSTRSATAKPQHADVAITSPAIRYHGAKFRIAPWIVSHLPPHSTYVEPFGGAAGVLLNKPRSYAEIYNDLDDDVVNLFQVLRSERAPELLASLRSTPFARAEFELAVLFFKDGEVKERSVGLVKLSDLEAKLQSIL